MVWSPRSSRGVKPVAYQRISAFGRHFLPSSFKFTSIQLNHNFASALHVDDYNSGPSYIVGLGTYEGGELWTLEHGPLDCHHRFCHYDGTEPHATLPFTGEIHASLLHAPDAP